MKSKASTYWLLLILIPAGVLGYAAMDYFQDQFQPAEAGAKNGTSNDPAAGSLVYPGFVESSSGVSNISSLKVERIVEIPVTPSSRVKSGKPLILLDDRTAQSLVSQANANLKLAKRNLDVARESAERYPFKVQQQQEAILSHESGLEQAKNNFEVQNKRLELRQITQEELNVAKAKLEQATHLLNIEESKLKELQAFDSHLELDLAQLQIDQAGIRVNQAKLDLENCTIRAPADGDVVRINSKIGELVGPTTSSIEFLPKSDLIVRTKVEQIHIDQIAIGALVVIRDYHQKDRTWSGQIHRIAYSFSRGIQVLDGRTGFSDVRVIECEVSINGNTDNLRIGQRVWIEIAE